MTLASLDAHPRRRHTHSSPTDDAASRISTRSTALPAFADLGDNDTLGRHYALLYLASRRRDSTG
jgi:hypothetical protein